MQKEKWTMPKWMEAFRTTFLYTADDSIENLMNDHQTTMDENPVLFCLIILVRAQVELLERLYKERRIHLIRWFDDSPDAGHSDCICSFCGKQIHSLKDDEERSPPIRLFNEKKMEARFHTECWNKVQEIDYLADLENIL